ncbi:MAG: hypothetical protein ACTSQY_00955 [Candidatus Odinarchaeia archaeon]
MATIIRIKKKGGKLVGVDSNGIEHDFLMEGESDTYYNDTKLQFRDSGLYINSSQDGQLDIVADTTVAISGAVTFDDTVSLADDKKLYFGADSDFAMEYDEDGNDFLSITGADMLIEGNSGAQKLQFRDSGLYINSSADGQLDIVSDTTVAISGAVTMDSTLGLSGILTLSGADANNTITFTGTNTAATPALKFPDDTYIADADGALGAAAGFIVVDIGGTNYKIQTYAMS